MESDSDTDIKPELTSRNIKIELTPPYIKNMESDSDTDMEMELTPVNIKMELTPPDIKLVEDNKKTKSGLLPEASNKTYQRAYAIFIKWAANKKVKSFSENVLIAYFSEMAMKFKSSTLWSQYSMLKTTLSINNNVDIGKYLKLKSFLKQQSDGYRPKTSKIFTTYEITKFIEEAPDEKYLVTKVALIMGLLGACRRHELYHMKMANFNDLGTSVLVTVPDRRTKVVRNFIIASHYYEIFKKYINLRPPNVNGPWFFLNYQNGKCTCQRIGINKLGAMGRTIAKYLNLPNPELYTGHCFRRSSATILIDGDGDITTLKRYGTWKSTPAAEDYIDESIKNKLGMVSKIQNAIENKFKMGENITQPKPSMSGVNNDHEQLLNETVENCQYDDISIKQISSSSIPMVFNNCTFNFTS